VAGRFIGDNQPAFIIAEAACNHMCDLDLAFQMIDEAAATGADAIKFQTYSAEKLVTDQAVAFWGEDKIRQIDYYRKLDRFGKKEYAKLFSHAREKGIVAFSSPFDEKNSAMLIELGMPLIKIASCDIPNIPFVEFLADSGKPIILSTGASTEEEIDAAVNTILKKNTALMLMACTLSYPTAPPDANLLRIQTLKNRYPELTIGISDHTEPDPHMVIPAAAVTMGAKLVEKHYTLDRSMTGSGHWFAVDPVYLRAMVKNIRLVETIRGDGQLGVAPAEEKAFDSARRSIVAEGVIPVGTIITRTMIGSKRPPLGHPPSAMDLFVGKRATRDISHDEYLKTDMVEEI
jgi:sialic acid synthase SpsE